MTLLLLRLQGYGLWVFLGLGFLPATVADTPTTRAGLWLPGGGGDQRKPPYDAAATRLAMAAYERKARPRAKRGGSQGFMSLINCLVWTWLGMDGVLYFCREPMPLAMSVSKSDFKRITTNVLQEMKRREERISMLTAYDFTMAKILDRSGVDVLLVGDSASNVMAGHETTLPITLDQMIYHASSVVRACERALVVVDMPFGSYQGNSKEALSSAIRIMKESGAHAVKMEGGVEIIEGIERILTAGIPVMGHLGLTPQSIYKFGTYTVRAREETEADKLLSDAKALEEAGCFALVLEKIPADLAKQVAGQLSIPVIGIGAGGGVDGQVLVVHDLLGMTHEFHPRFLRRYLNLFEEISQAVGQYVKDVKSADFPNEQEQY
jgi:3-methyl-2-oxobutanoate hydroxymethyltransferase